LSSKVNNKKIIPKPENQGNGIYNVYIDEAGQTPYYNDKDQRVLTLAGVITDKDESKFDSYTRSLLTEYKLPLDTEIHINEIFSRKPPFNKFDKSAKQEFVFRFLKKGMDYIDYVHAPSSIKPYIKPEVRMVLAERNLDLYLNTLYHFAVELDFYFFKSNKGKYRLIFDEHRDINKRTKRMVEELCKESSNYYFLKRIAGPPEKLDSKCSRFIQLADAVCYVYSRYRQFEVKTLKKPKNLIKYEDFYKKCYFLIKDKLLPFFKLYLDGIFGESRTILNFKEFETRDFNHVGNWLTRKKPENDVFDPTANTFWEVDHLKMKVQVSTLEQLLNIIENSFNRLEVTNLALVPAVTLEIIERHKNRIKKANRGKKGWEQEFPEANRGLDLLEDFSKKIMENYSIPKTDLKNKLLIKEIADKFEIEVESKQIHDASVLEQYIKRNKYYFNKIISTMFFFRKTNENHVKSMMNAYTDNKDSQTPWKKLSIYAEYLKSYTEEINALDEDFFEAYKKVIMTLRIMILKISLFRQIQLEEQQSFKSYLKNLYIVLSDGISQYEKLSESLKHLMCIMEEAHHAFNSLGNLIKKIFDLKFYTQKLINILDMNINSNNLEKSIIGIPVIKQKIIPKRVKMRIPSYRKKQKRKR
jgi:hypothetical protein